jgi:hypothetical protein
MERNPGAIFFDANCTNWREFNSCRGAAGLENPNGILSISPALDDEAGLCRVDGRNEFNSDRVESIG